MSPVLWLAMIWLVGTRTAGATLTPLENLEPCLSDSGSQGNLRTLTYSDGSVHPVLIPFASWASAQVTSQIAHILLSEVMGYSTKLLSGIVTSNNPVNLAAGCADMNDVDCIDVNPLRPGVHFTVETWLFGITWASGLPGEIRPVIMTVFDYQTFDGIYVWPGTVEAGLRSREHLDLSYYNSYNAAYFKPFRFFDNWTKMLDLIPPYYRVTCAEMGPGSQNDRKMADYVRWTNNTDVECHHNDTIWFSPACLSNTTECVPLLMQYPTFTQVQQAFFLNMPFAILLVKSGLPEYDAVYYAAINKGNFLFHWFTPDDSLVDAAGNLPTQLILPPTNQLEQDENLYRTGNAFVQPRFPSRTEGHVGRNYAWPSLGEVSRHVSFFASSFDFFQEDIGPMMVESKRLKGLGYNDVTSSRRIACGWVKAQKQRWQPWIPALCPNGSHSTSLIVCTPCPPGSFCPGGISNLVACPVGSYCPGNTSEALPCPNGKDSIASGAVSLANCSVCKSGFLMLDGSCVALPVFICGILIPLVAFVILAAFTGFMYGSARAQRPEEDTELNRKMAELCERLGIARDYGAVLAAARVPMRRRMSIALSETLGTPILHKAEIEAAARLALFREHVDLKLVDTFCACLRGPSRAHKLRKWILELSSVLLDPSDRPSMPEFETTGGKGGKGGKVHPIDEPSWVYSALQGERFAYFKDKIGTLAIWQEDQGAILLKSLKEIVKKYLDDVANWCDARFNHMLSEPGGEILKAYSMKPPLERYDLTSTKACITKSNDVERSKSFRDKSTQAACPTNLSSSELIEGIAEGRLRQDSKEVKAIRVSEVDREEVSRQVSEPVIYPGAVDEEVFLAQLVARSKLLNSSFQTEVAAVVRERSSGRVSSSASFGFERLHSDDAKLVSVEFQLHESPSIVELHSSPPKGIERMREKLNKYPPPHPRAIWPFCANILDPIRCAIVCPGPAAMLAVVRWFTEFQEENGLPIVRVKNKFALPREQLSGGYRDMQLSVIFPGKGSLRIIGEVQIHDVELYKLKLKMHKLYKIWRAQSLIAL